MMKKRFRCTVQFRLNSKGQVAIASLLPTGFIIQVYVISLRDDGKYIAQEVGIENYKQIDAAV